MFHVLSTGDYPGYDVDVKVKNGIVRIKLMPKITCWRCGNEYWVDPYIKEAVVACNKCGAKSRIEDLGLSNYKITPIGAFVSEDLIENLLKPLFEDEVTKIRVWKKLTELEKRRLIEAAKCYAVGAYTACESMSYDALVSVLRRVYGEKRELGYYVEKMERDPDLKDVKGAIAYFAAKRHEVDHPERISNELDAKNALNMTIQLIKEILKRKVRKES